MGIVWALDLFNFMDGIDGIAAGEAVFVCLAAVLTAALAGGALTNNPAALLLAAASLGLLIWNWPPARIFMGDVGSGFLGFAIAVLALAEARHNDVALLVWAILGAFFVADSGVTLVRRMLRRARLHEAHRTHAYQHLAQRWRSHRLVTLAVLLGNLLWLLPAPASPRCIPDSPVTARSRHSCPRSSWCSPWAPDAKASPPAGARPRPPAFLPNYSGFPPLPTGQRCIPFATECPLWPIASGQ